MQKIINISEFEQGYIGSSGNTDNEYRIRTAGYIRENPLKSVVISATSSTGKTLQIELYGYRNSTDTTYILDKYWYDVPYEFDFSAYTELKFLRIVLRYKDGTKITPDELSECTMTEFFSWYSDSTGIHCEDMPEAPEKAVYSPFPKSLWRLSGELPHHELFPEVSEKSITKPYPLSFWRIDNKVSNLPYHELMPLEVPAGAFMGAENLEYARIPETVRKIGRYAFTDTALKKIRISPECEYYETSFPKDCLVEFYGQSVDEHAGQLYDSESNILIDIDGARIYIQE